MPLWPWTATRNSRYLTGPPPRPWGRGLTLDSCLQAGAASPRICLGADHECLWVWHTAALFTLVATASSPPQQFTSTQAAHAWPYWGRDFA